MAIKKKPVKKTTSTVKVNEIKKAVKKEAKVIGKEGQVIWAKLGTRWENSSTEEKIYTILGILLLIWGLYVLKSLIGGMLLIVVGILFVTGFFMKKGGK